MKSLFLDGLTLSNELDLQKCYIRALIDDDTYCTQFGKITSESQLTWNDSIYLPLKQRNLEETSVYVMVCVNTESEISFLDTMIANVSNLFFLSILV